MQKNINPLNAKLNPICHFLALLGAHPILHVSRIRVNMIHGPMNIKFVIILLSVLLRMGNVADKFVEKIKRHILCLLTFFFKNRAVFDIMWKKYCRAGGRPHDNMGHGHCMLDT
jgi:hypothetical protein